MKTIRRQRKAAELREQWRAEGLQVPPMMIVSITQQCNLRCKGCYANVFKINGSQELTGTRFEDLLRESSELGISTIFLAGGEPLLRKDILEVTGRYRHIIFPFFTNGTLINDQWLNVFHGQKNLIPIISLEGQREQTDERRGRGVYDMFL
ncbi:MAG: radical SAM protein [Bacteroidetes bacterium]|nr:radical SAM protein [Bacteroidota bacterium]